jgi:hypothetical protein
MRCSVLSTLDREFSLVRVVRAGPAHTDEALALVDALADDPFPGRSRGLRPMRH